MAEEKKKRIELLDALRGFGVLVMVMHHILYDLIVFCGARFQLFGNVIFDSLHYIAAGSFLVLAGISSRFSRSNVKRGVKLFLVAMCFTVVTSLPMIDLPIRFGVLHLLGASMVFYGLTAEAWNGIPRKVMPVLCVALLVGSALAVKYIEVSPAVAHVIFPLGWMYPGFFSADWFPIFPWFFVYLFGPWVGYYVKERKFPGWFYTASVPVLPFVGRHALFIYIVHQPVIYGVIMLIQKLG